MDDSGTMSRFLRSALLSSTCIHPSISSPCSLHWTITTYMKKKKLTSAARYSRTAARYTGAPEPTRCAYRPFLRRDGFDELDDGEGEAAENRGALRRRPARHLPAPRLLLPRPPPLPLPPHLHGRRPPRRQRRRRQPFPAAANAAAADADPAAPVWSGPENHVLSSRRPEPARRLSCLAPPSSRPATALHRRSRDHRRLAGSPHRATMEERDEKSGKQRR